MTNVNNRCSSQGMNSVPFEYKVRVHCNFWRTVRLGLWPLT